MKLQHIKAMYPFQRCLLEVTDRVVLAMGHAPIAQVTSLLQFGADVIDPEITVSCDTVLCKATTPA
jgi:hypothetical protein